MWCSSRGSFAPQDELKAYVERKLKDVCFRPEADARRNERGGMDIVVECTGLTSEASFWQAYLGAAKPEGASSFGRNLDAFRDAILGGGPGWPGECAIRLVSFDQLRTIEDGRFCAALERLAAESRHVTIRFE